MKNLEIKSPEEILNGTVKYSNEQFRTDLISLHEPAFTNQRQRDSLNALCDNIIEDTKTENEPEDFLKQFYQLFYYKLDTGDNDRAVIINSEFILVSYFTYYVYLLYGANLRDRHLSGNLTDKKFAKIRKKYIESFREFMEEWGIHESLLYVAATG
jgi:hypothetical protein